MLRMLGAAQKREVKATQNLSFIVLFFMICWIPLYTINCVQAFCVNCEINRTLTNFCIILSHLNSAGNPLLYAYHLRDFRAALKHYILSLFGIKEAKAPCLERNRPSLASTNCSRRIPFVRHNMEVNKKVPICMPIVTTTAAVAAASAGERANRDMWMITEVPSSSLSDNHLDRDGCVFPANTQIVKDMTSDSTSSGKINSGYVEGPIDDLEIGDDDVFYADASTLSVNDSNCESESSEIIKRPDKNVEIVAHPTTKLTKRNSKTWCLSTSSPQLSRSLFVVEAEVCNGKSREAARRSSADKKNANGMTLSTSGDFSPARSLKLSPFKAVGEFLLQHTSNKHSKSTNRIEEVSYRDLSIVPYDANLNGAVINQKQTNDTIGS